jgi:hypothetical protein
MAKTDILPYQLNLELRKQFEALGLDIAEVMRFSSFDLDLENRRLAGLLDFIQRYRKCGSDKAAMELISGNYEFPPIYPGIDPESDWYRFELWLEGKPTRLTLAEQLPQTLKFKKPEEVSEDELPAALEQLCEAIHQTGIGIGLQDDLPDRLLYAYLLESLGDTFELSNAEKGFGGWHIDGCSGYCPGCIQRPWCDAGQTSCWTEDEEAGKMHLTDELKDFVSASPQSLKILQISQAKEDASFAKYEKENPEDEFGMGESWKVGLN